MTGRSLAVFVFTVAAAGMFAGGCGTSPSIVGCDPACTAGFHCAESACVADAVVDDAGAQGEMAVAGCNPACVAPKAFCSTGNRCVACLEDSQCPLGTVCQTRQGGEPACVPGCADDKRCAKGLACCGGQCVDTNIDAANCGGCAMACNPVNSSGACMVGKCVIGPCRDGYSDCNNDPADGCEAHLLVDKDNCGACGMKCSFPNAVAACSHTCYLAACDFGYDDCNGKADDGCETATVSDPGNCGACGVRCPVPPHARPLCANAGCGISFCDMGWADCNQQAGDGCETNIGTDASHCGACANACPQGLICVGGGCTCQQCNIPNASARCINNQCLFDKCNPGFLDCDNNQANGCEVNSLADGKNCGGCGVVCGNGMSCVNGVCSSVVHGCNATGMARGCVNVNDACWCKTGGQFATGRDVCGYPQNYAGIYYSINGRDSQNVNGPMDGNKARVILAALGQVPSANYCAANAQMGSCSQSCSCDCATNILAGDNGGSWGSAMSCWTDQQRWDRGTNIVRCTGYEQ